MSKPLILGLLLFLMTSTAFSQIDPHRRWKVMETKHFEIIYDETQKNLAQILARDAEWAEIVLQPFLKTPLDVKVPLVVADVTDSPNGFASFLPRYHIVAFPVVPSVHDSIGEYEDWSRDLILHEYTHVLNFEPTSGAMQVMRNIFGSIIRPAGLMPRWYMEGLAVETESRFTNGGRGRSHYYSGLLRAEVESGAWGEETIDRVNATTIPSWPRGSRPYFYGYYLMNHLSEITAQKEKVYDTLNHRYGGRFPFFYVDTPPMDYFGGKNWQMVLNDMYTKWDAKAKSQLQILKSKPTTKLEPLQSEAYLMTNPRISPDGLKLAAVVNRYDEEPGIEIWQRNSLKEPFTQIFPMEKKIANLPGVGCVDWRGDSRTLVFTKTEITNNFNEFDDLQEIDILDPKGKIKRLTRNLRVRDFTILPDGSLAVISGANSLTTLLKTDASGQNSEVIMTAPAGERLSSPRPYLEGVIYSHRDNKNREWIEYYNFKNNQTTKLTQATKPGDLHLTPVADPKKPGAFYFASSENGVMNLFYSDSKKTKAITHITSYAYSPEIDPHTNNVIFSHLTGKGFALKQASLTSNLESLPKIQPNHGYPVPQTPEAPPLEILGESSYSGVSYLFPQFIFPFVFIVPDGVLASISTSGMDPLLHHEYSLGTSYDSRNQLFSGQLLYSNWVIPSTNVKTIASHDNVFLFGPKTTLTVSYFEMDSLTYLSKDSNDWAAGLIASYRAVQRRSLFATEIGPGVQLAYNPLRLRVRDFQISPDSGQFFNIEYNYFLPGVSNNPYQAFGGTGAFYFGKGWLPKYHAISFKTDFWVAPPQNTIYTGTREGGGEYFFSLGRQRFIVRGYPPSEFLGSTMVSGNFEYRFPVMLDYSGNGTSPVFTNKWHGAFVFDALTLDGGYFDSQSEPSPLLSTKLGTYYLGAGGELRGDMVLFYGLPVTLRFGLYNGFTAAAFGGTTFNIAFGSNL